MTWIFKFDFMVPVTFDTQNLYYILDAWLGISDAAYIRGHLGFHYNEVGFVNVGQGK